MVSTLYQKSKKRIYTYISKFFRILRNIVDKYQLKNYDFSIISNTCIGSVISSDLGLRFLSPTVNLYIKPSDFVTFLQNIDFYLSQELSQVYAPPPPLYPLGKLYDIIIYFKHYSSFDEAYQKWNERKKRINFNNLFIMMTDRHIDIENQPKEPYSCSYKTLQAFDALPFQKKICFTHKGYKELKSCYFLKEQSGNKCVGIITEIVDMFGKRMYQQSHFDYVKWLNVR